jgi:acyl-CoA synthetase (AMP-forming)/AMP-acid ligase II
MPENPLIAILDTSPLPRLERIGDYLDHWADTRPTADAAGDDEQHIGYADLRTRVDGLAMLLLDMGVAKGDCIAQLAPPGVRFWSLFLACARIGVTWLGLNPRYTRDELAWIIGDSRPRLIIAEREIDGRDYTDDLDAICTEFELPYWRSAQAFFTSTVSAASHLLDDARKQVSSSDVVLRVYTSGSTGKPKGAQLSSGAIARAAWVHASIWYVEPMRLLNNLPINHVGCVCDLACTALAGGGYSAFMPRFDAEGSLRLIEQDRLTLWGQVPTQFQMSLTKAPEHFDLSSLKLIIWSGARASDDLIRALYAICGNLATSYGMTETVGSVALTPQLSDPADFVDMAGWPDPGRGVRLSDNGEILVKDDWLMSGYLNRPEATADSYTDGWFRTGDLARWTDHGALTITGRAKEMFKSGGYNVYPREVEEALERYADVREVTVVGMPNPLFDEVGCAFVVPVAAARLDIKALEAHARKILANYKIPKRFVILDALPMLAIGKIDRTRLKQLAQEQQP